MATHHDTSSPRETSRASEGSQSWNPLVAKLSAPVELSEEDRRAANAICQNVREVQARRDVISEGDNPRHVHLILEGWAARYKVVPNGARQIMAILLPGDFCDLHVTILGEMDHGITALTRVKVAQVPHQAVEDLPMDRPQLGRAMWWASLVDEATLRAWIVNLGRRDAAERIAHLFCELHARLKLVGLVEEDRFSLPLTQEVLADALGLTSVHINRILQRLRSDDLIELGGGELTILNLPALRKLAGFDPNYLHRGRLAQSR